MPVAARVYLVFIALVGLCAFAVSQLVELPMAGAEAWEPVIFIALAVIAGGKKVTLTKLLNGEAGSMSLGFVITFTALLRFGPAMAVMVGAATCLSSCLFPKRMPLHQLAFNVGLGAFEALAGGMLFLWLNNGSLDLKSAQSFTAVVATATTFFLVNTIGVSTIIALCTGENVFGTWKSNFLWTWPSYVASASIGALSILIFKGHVSGILLFVAPVVYLVYQSYVVYISRAEDNLQHVKEMQLNQEHLAELYLSTIKSLALAIDAKDQYTHQHILRVQRYAVAIAKQMGLTGADLEAVNTGALLHDIGKLGVPEYVLLKPGRLTPEEFDKIKKHPEIGAAILDPVEFPWPVLPVVRHHHEKWDGTGYPDGLAGEDIPLSARIMAVADVYDALTSSRSYRRAWPHEKAVATISKDAGSHFDPIVVDAFIAVIGEVVREMAECGEGPLVPQAPSQQAESKSQQAANDISRCSAELWAIYEVAQSLSTSIGTSDTIHILSGKLSAIFPGVSSTLLLREEDGSLKVRAARGLNSHFFSGGHTNGEQSLSCRVLAVGETHRGEYDADDLMLSGNELDEWVELQSCLIVPIVHEGHTLGTINLYDPELDAFSPYDSQIVELISERVAPAICNGLLFDRNHADTDCDTLTGLHSMRFLSEHLDSRCRLLLENDGPSFALLALDLESFHSINAGFGHEKGDSVLCDMAVLLRGVVGKNGIVARFGGDVFMLVVEARDRKHALTIARAVERTIEGYDPGLSRHGVGDLTVSASIGASIFPIDGADSAKLIAAADSDMRREKTERKLRALSKTSRRAKAA
jgi:diguanylate cyclase (GGDEF)-like protein/putative nucleotidyltransferase with HDIG domain